jgi:hypothetical protein
VRKNLQEVSARFVGLRSSRYHEGTLNRLKAWDPFNSQCLITFASFKSLDPSNASQGGFVSRCFGPAQARSLTPILSLEA